jgi:GTPase SAR1 family protein
MDTEHPAVFLGTLATGEALWIWSEARDRHLYVIGASGAGKTTLLRHLILSDLAAGAGFALIDPHGDIATEIADSIPADRTGQVIYFDPADLSHPIGFNPVEGVPVDQRALRAAHIIATFEHLWRAFWGPRMSYILENAIRLLLDAPGATLLGLPRLLTDRAYRAALLTTCVDPVIKRYWLVEYEAYDKRSEAEAIAPILNKIGALISKPSIRNIIGQPKSTLDIPAIMDSGRMLIVNLSKGRIGEDATHLLGAFLTTAISQAAEARADIAEPDRRPFTLYADEFQNFATESFGTILSEARKYRLALVIAHQILGQLPDSLRQAVLGNVGTVISFRIGAEDAPAIADAIAFPNAEALTQTRNHSAWVRTLYDGHPTRAYHVDLPKPYSMRLGQLEAVKARTAARHARKRADVEMRINRFMQGGGGKDNGKPGKLKVKHRVITVRKPSTHRLKKPHHRPYEQPWLDASDAKG